MMYIQITIIIIKTFLLCGLKKIGNDFIIEGKEQAKQYIINYIKSNYNVAWVKQKENTIEFKIEKDLDKYFIVGYINRVWV